MLVSASSYRHWLHHVVFVSFLIPYSVLLKLTWHGTCLYVRSTEAAKIKLKLKHVNAALKYSVHVSSCSGAQPVACNYIKSRLYHNYFSENLRKLFFDSFVTNAPFLYPLKTSENHKVFWCFQGLEKGCIGNKWVKNHIRLITSTSARICRIKWVEDKCKNLYFRQKMWLWKKML